MSGESLECTWQKVDNTRLKPNIQSGPLLTSTTSTHIDCRQLCVEQTTFLCAAYNFNPTSKECELLAENAETATAESANEWKYYIRPACAGMWLPWQSAREKTLTGGDRNMTETDNLRTCMSNCLTTERTCRAIIKSTSSRECLLVTKRSDDEGVTTTDSTDVQYYDRPAWYLNNSLAATLPAVDVITGRGSQLSLHLLTNKVVPVEGYLVAWQYFVGSTATEACESYAAIWRRETNTYRRIVETHITPDHTTIGVKFQYVQDSVTVVKAGDFLGLHVVSDGNCGGHTITFTNNGGEQVSIYKGADQNSRPKAISADSVDLSTSDRYFSIRAYIATYLTLDAPSTNHLSTLSQGQIRVTWQLPSDVQDQAESGVVRVQCATDSKFVSLVECTSSTALLEERESLLYIADVRQPYYARLHIVRNYNGEELVQNPDNPHYLVNGGNLFCLERDMLPDNGVTVIESGVLSPGNTRMITVSIPSIVNDACVGGVKLTYETGTLDNQDKTVSWTFSKEQGVTFKLTIYLQLVDRYETVVWDREYTTRQAPSPPTGLDATEITTNSVLLKWTEPTYSNLANPISAYQITCTLPDGTPAIEHATPTAVDRYKIEPLLKGQQCKCTVKALLADGGYGETSVPITFTTLSVVVPPYSTTTSEPTPTTIVTVQRSAEDSTVTLAASIHSSTADTPSSAITGLVVGIVCTSIVAVLLLVALIALWMRHRRLASQQKDEKDSAKQESQKTDTAAAYTDLNTVTDEHTYERVDVNGVVTMDIDRVEYKNFSTKVTHGVPTKQEAVGSEASEYEKVS